MKNSSVPSPRNWPEEKRKKKRGGLRAIDAGSRYDVPGQLRKLARQIERGEHGRVTDVAGAVRGIFPDGVYSFGFHAGTGDVEVVTYMPRRYVGKMEI